MLAGVPAIYHMQDTINSRNASRHLMFLTPALAKSLLVNHRSNSLILIWGGAVSVVPNSSNDQSYMLFEMINSTATLVSIPIPMAKLFIRWENVR